MRSAPPLTQSSHFLDLMSVQMHYPQYNQTCRQYNILNDIYDEQWIKASHPLRSLPKFTEIICKVFDPIDAKFLMTLWISWIVVEVDCLIISGVAWLKLINHESNSRLAAVKDWARCQSGIDARCVSWSKLCRIWRAKKENRQSGKGNEGPHHKKSNQSLTKLVPLDDKL